MTCPICRQPTSWEKNPWRPFCSERCQLTDLGTWATEQYRIPGSSLTMDAPSTDSHDDEQADDHADKK